MRLRIARRAQNDIESQIDFLSTHAPQAAEKAFGRLFGSIRALREFPRMGRPAAGNAREMVVRFGRDGFIVRYRLEGDLVVIDRVFHGRQDRA